ncbi:MAG: septum formation initiator family protein [Oscillospiraceae bacterium]
MRVKRAGLLTKILILALLIVVAISLLELNSRVDQAQAQKEDLARQVAAQTQTNADLADAIEHSDDPDRIADVARERLGLVAPGEIIFYSMGD